jgi:hypothetical protein
MQVRARSIPLLSRASAARPTCIQQVLGCDCFDHPPVTHRLDGEAASAATADLQDAPSPDSKALHRDLREVTGPGQLEVAPPYLAKLWQSNDQTTRQRPGESNRPTFGDLDAIMANLPRLLPPLAPHTATERTPGAARQTFYRVLFAYVVINLFLIGIWAFSGRGAFGRFG